MELKIELEKIAKRLFDEGICSQPLSESALKEIFRYMGMSQTGSELMRRLSDVENNYDEISREAEDSVKRVKETITDCDKIFGALINEWDRKGLTDAYSFSKDSSTLSRMYQSYSAMTENLSDKIITIENACDLLAETAAQTKACTASFLEIYYETRLAYYAAALNKDKENLLSCRAISLQAHGSSHESSCKAMRYLSASRSAATALTVINEVISETTVCFKELSSENQIRNGIIVKKFVGGIEKLRALTSSKNLN